MSRYHQRSLFATAVMMIALYTPLVNSGEPSKQGRWLRERDAETGREVRTMEMTLQPRGEPRPALKHRLLPDDFEMLEGNAAIYYLKAMGFLEQDPARNRLREVMVEAGERARKENKEFGDVPPYGWLTMSPEELPLKEVKDFLRLTSFQPQYLKEAAQRRRFDLDRNLRDVRDPIGYLLPDVQLIRELARMQKLRCKIAIAEGRLNEAIEVLGQQYAMARHLGQDEFLVSDLVGIACAEIAWEDALYLVQHPDSPNLYWALASLPHPLIDIRHSMAVERQFLYLQLKALREVDETPRPAGYWQDFLDRVASQMGSLDIADFGMPGLRTPQAANDAATRDEAPRTSLVAFVAAAYPGAKRYLIDELKLPREQVEAYPTAQVVFLAMVRFHDEARDDNFKWNALPYWQTQTKLGSQQIKEEQERARIRAARIGWAAMPAQQFMPAVFAANTAVNRIEQQLALIQTVEAIRMYGAAQGGKLPKMLDDLPVPAPLEPFTGKPLDYQYHDEHAVLNGHALPGLRYRLVLRFANEAQ